MKTIRRKIRQESARIQREFRERIIGYILAAFGIVAGLAWNDFVKSLIDAAFPAQTGNKGITAKFVYALAITFVIVIISVYLTRLAGQEDEKEEQEKEETKR